MGGIKGGRFLWVGSELISRTQIRDEEESERSLLLGVFLGSFLIDFYQNFAYNCLIVCLNF